MSPHRPPPSSDQPGDQPRLTTALRALQPPIPPKLDEVDQAVLDAARAHFDQPADTRTRSHPRWLPRLAAAAAIIGLTVTVAIFVQPRRPAPQLAQNALIPGDVDGSGRVDILDALRLAQQIDAGTALPSSDLTGDDVIDQRDVDAIAARAVQLPEVSS
jgi:hypothetical protein